jgi:CHASE2 domain-containing sensor protein
LYKSTDTPFILEGKTSITEKPSGVWYLLPLFFALLGGIVGYVAVKDRDASMANGLLLLGVVVTVILLIFGFL